MSDDETRPIGPGPGPTEATAPTEPTDATAPADATAPPAAPPGFAAYGGTAQPPPYAMPLPAGAYPMYAAAPQRPRFVDQVLGMRAVIAVALACLLIGGLSGWILGRASADDNGGFGGPGMFQQRGTFPGAPNGQVPNSRFGPGQTP